MKKTKRMLALLLAGLLTVPNAVLLEAEELSDGAVVEEIASEELPVVGDTNVIEVPDPVEIKDVVVSPEDGAYMHSGDTYSMNFKITGTDELPSGIHFYNYANYIDNNGNNNSYYSIIPDYYLDVEKGSYYANGESVIFDNLSLSVDNNMNFSFTAQLKESDYYRLNMYQIYAYYSNTVYGDVYKSVYIDDDCAEGRHTIRSNTNFTIDKQATCTEPGSQSKHCIKCNSIVEDTAEEIPALGHDWYEGYKREPTCGEEGYCNYYCHRCEESRKEIIPATGEHNWVKGGCAGNCEVGGSTYYYCTKCAGEKEEAFPSNEHTWGDWKKIDNPTDPDYPKERRECLYCFETEVRDGENPCEHDWEDWKEIITDDLYITRTCKVCGKIETLYEYHVRYAVNVVNRNYEPFDVTLQLLDNQGIVVDEWSVHSDQVETRNNGHTLPLLKPNEVYSIKPISCTEGYSAPTVTICNKEDYSVDQDKTSANITGNYYNDNTELRYEIIKNDTTPTPTPTITPYDPEIIYVPVTPTPAPVDHEAYIPPIEECSVTGLEEARVYAPSKYYSFKGVGASAETKYSVRTIGDGKWIPAYWSFDEAGEDNDTRFKLGHDDGIEAGTHDLYVWFRLFKWDGEDWMASATVKSIKTQFVAEEAITPTPEPTQTPTPEPTETPTPEPEPSVTAPKTVITKLEDTGSGNLRIYWRSMEDKVDGYQIRWATNKDMTGVKTATYTGINNTTRPNLSLGKVYYVGIRTFVMNDGKKVYSEWSGTKAIKLTRTLATPSVSGASQKGTGIQTKWFTVADAEGYQLRFCQDSSFKGARTASVSGQNKTSFTKYGLGSGTWYVAVRAYKTADDSVRYYSVWSGTQIVELK